MSSQITNIYSAIAGWSVVAAGRTVRTRDIDAVKNQFTAGDAPLRMMLVSTGDTEVSSAPFVALGKAQHITWVIEDRLYWRPVAQGEGLLDFNADLIAYVAAYLEVVRGNRSPTSQSTIVDCRAVPAIVRWPDAEGGTEYAGVRCFLTIDEYVTGA